MVPSTLRVHVHIVRHDSIKGGDVCKSFRLLCHLLSSMEVSWASFSLRGASRTWMCVCARKHALQCRATPTTRVHPSPPLTLLLLLLLLWWWWWWWEVGETSVKCVERVGKSIRYRWSLDYMLRLRCSCLNRAQRLRHPVRWHVVRTLV
jgi:hypothetical protein